MMVDTFFVEYSRLIDIYIGSVFDPMYKAFINIVYKSAFIYLKSRILRSVGINSAVKGVQLNLSTLASSSTQS